MDSQNKTQGTEFILLGFSSLLSHQIHLFLVFLAAYLATLMGNLMIVTLILLDSCLHTPMYFFLSQLSCLDVCLSSVVVPKILVNFLRQEQTISYNQCLAQAFFLIGFAGCEPALLSVMAYDRYAAICQPLHYAHLMRGKLCVQLSVAIWLWGFLDSTIYTALASRLEFCGNHLIPHIFCDVPPLLKIACSDTSVNELSTHITGTLVGLVPLLLIVLSYFYILSSILQIRSKIGRRKAFSTCASHLAVVTLFVGNAFVNYNQPSAGYSLEVDTLISTMFCIVTPMLNPLIYSLRNREVKEALRKILKCWRKA
ncbi:olfactory receptor 5V1-like [Protobothrops mucrosquamatus]|uniref:olfactory receptor 5V1-like n=1 Tax=Protobothrops mucrosquamatus TaxID=103944 RepID=UPI0010FBA7E7|nr:olfactory receptor 5V1-like [Protobothrops mucrosquamatus]